jgi:uncharacterized protein YndB with AHSA1/START domain
MALNTMRQAPLGSIRQSGDEQVLRYERQLDHSADRVWTALTEPSGLTTWLFAPDKLELVDGGEVVLRWLNLPKSSTEVQAWRSRGMVVGDEIDDGSYVMHGRVTELEPQRVFEFETDGTGMIRFDLRPSGEGCLLTFTNKVALPEEETLQTLAGFHVHLDHLVDSLDGNPIDWPNWTRDHLDEWAEMCERYAAGSADSEHGQMSPGKED